MVEYRKNHRYYKCTSCGTALDATREPKCAPCKRTRDRDYHLKSTYGMTSREYEEMLKTQGGGCAVCGSKEKSSGRDYLHVDHDHITGVVRSILCHRCNVTVGLLREDPIHAELVLGYIKGLQAISACSTK
jgi:DNA-directed RNA polymerase subunit RPC12/RpoP